MKEEEYLQHLSHISKLYGASRVYLFGSRAAGRHRHNSDFDIAVQGTKEVARIREAVDDLQTLFSADIVDMDTCRNELLLSEIREHGILI